MELDQLKDAAEKDIVCVGAQRLLRLERLIGSALSEEAWVDDVGRYRRLTTIHIEVRSLILEACPVRHVEHLADELSTARLLDRVKQAVDAAFVGWVRK